MADFSHDINLQIEETNASSLPQIPISSFQPLPSHADPSLILANFPPNHSQQMFAEDRQDYTNFPIDEMTLLPFPQSLITTFNPPVWQVDHSLTPPKFPPTQNPPTSAQNKFLSQVQDNPRVIELANSQRQTSQLSTRKRAPKAATISATNWKPHEGRIRQLYVTEKKTIEEMRDIMNKDLGMEATLRQYKLQIKHMGLERNVKFDERKAIVKHIQHRTNVLWKKNSIVRVRKHPIDPKKLSRWLKENGTNQPFVSKNPPSPLQSCISIYTSSVRSSKLVSSVLLQSQFPGNESVFSSNGQKSAIERLLNYVRVPKPLLESQEARYVFNDLQSILSCEHKTYIRDPFEVLYGKSRAHVVEHDVTRIRNLMNLTPGLAVDRNWNGISEPMHVLLHKDPSITRLASSYRHSNWNTPYESVRTSFWEFSGDSVQVSRERNDIDTSDKGFAASITIVPRDLRTSSFRVVFDITPHLDPAAKITYQAIRPNDSEIFRIVTSGEVERLIEALARGTASLTDRDEDGRSLLNYAAYNAQPDICKFLVDKGADVNAIERNLTDPESIGHMFSAWKHNDTECDEKKLHRRGDCIRILIQAGGDSSLEMHYEDGKWVTGFMDIVMSRSLASLKHILDFGQQFISLNMTYKDFYGFECFSLTALADNCGYDTLEAIDVVEKAIFLLQRKVDISCRGSNGDTVLHKLFRSDRLHSVVSKAQAKSNTGGIMWQYPLSFTTPKDLLMVFITAGADVYAINDHRHTPSDIALAYGWEEEWIEALILCGYNAAEVIADSDPCLQESTREPQTSKLSFEDYCRQRSKKSRFKNTEMDEEQFEEAMEAIEADREEFMKNHGERYDEAIKAYNEIYGEEELQYDETDASQDEYGEFSQQAGDDLRDLELSVTDTLRPQRAEFSDHWTKLGLEDTNLEREGITGVVDHSGGMDINGNQGNDFAGVDLCFGNDLLSNYEDYGGGMIVDRPQENGFSEGTDMGFGNHWPFSNVGYGETMAFDGVQENDFAPGQAGMDLSFGNNWQDSGVDQGARTVPSGAQENYFAGMDLSFGNDWLSNA